MPGEVSGSSKVKPVQPGASSDGKEPSFLAKAYFWFEDRYYDECDFLQNLGVPIYKYWVDPIESRGIPSFPVTVFLILALLALLWFLMLPPANVDLHVRVVGGGKPVSGANVSMVLDDTLTWRYSSTKGSVVFAGLPPGKNVFVNVSKKGYDDFNRSVLLEESRSLTANLQSDALDGLQSPSDSLLVRVFAQDKKPVSGARVTYLSPAGVELGSLLTNSNGAATVLFDGVNHLIYLDVEKKGFKKVRRLGVLFSKGSIDINLKPLEEEVQKARLIVQVVNSSGSPVKSTVSLFNALAGTGPLQQKVTDGVEAEFEVEKGSLLFVNADLVSSSDKNKYLPYRGETDAFKVTEDPFVFVVTLQGNDGSFDSATLRVLEKGSNNTLPGVEVTLYDSVSNRYLDMSHTDLSGKVVFSMSNKTIGYVTAFSQGFLPGAAVNVKVGSVRTVYLERATLNNSGKARVFVEEVNGSKVSSAKVVLHYALDNRLLGLPDEETNSSGFVVFDFVPTGVALKARAVKGARDGEGGEFNAVASRTVDSTVVLNAGSGNVSVKVVDAFTTSPIEGAGVVAFSSDVGTMDSCTTDSKGLCVVGVRAYADFSISASAIGYEDSSIEQDALFVDEVRSVDFSLRDLSKKDEFSVQLLSVKGEDGEEAFFVERGREYTATFAVYFPSNLSNALGGFYVRLGDEGSVDDYDFVLLDPPEGFTRGKEHSDACLQEALSDCGEGCKWLRTDFGDVSESDAARSVEVSFKARAVNLSEDEEVKINFRAFAEVSIDGSAVYLRSPQDDSIPEEFDFCTAATYTVAIPLRRGLTTCTEETCLSLIFEKDGVEYGAGFKVQKGEAFNVLVQARPLGASSSSRLYFKLSPHSTVDSYAFDSPAVESNGMIVVDALQGGVDGSVSLTAGIPSREDSAWVFANHSRTIQGGVESLEQYAFYTVEGEDWLEVSVSPSEVFKGEMNDLTVSVSTSLGEPVSSAIITLNNFDGFPLDPPFPQVLGDGSDGKGRDGVYSFTGVAPSADGIIVVEAVSGLVRGSANVDVSKRPFFEVSPLEIYVCNDDVGLTIKNKVDANVQVSITTSSLNCLEKMDALDFDQNNGRQYLLNAQEERFLSLQGFDPSSCTILIEASLADETVAYQIPFSNCDSSPGSPAPSCSIVFDVESGTGPFDSGMTATWDNLPQGISEALLSCDDSVAGSSSYSIDSSSQSSRTCSYSSVPVTTTFTAKAGISSTPEVVIGKGVGECSFDVTNYNKISGVDFVINDQAPGIHVLTPQYALRVSPLIPNGAFVVRVFNQLDEPRTVGVLFEDGARNSFESYEGSNPKEQFVVDAGEELEFTVAFGKKLPQEPSFEAVGGGVGLLPVAKTTLSLMFAVTGGASASSEISIAQETGSENFAFVRIPITSSGSFDVSGSYSELFMLFANNIQKSGATIEVHADSSFSPSENSVSSASSVLTKYAGSFAGTNGFYQAEVPVGSASQADFSSSSSPWLADASNVKAAITSAYNTLWSSTTTEVAQNVLNLNPSASIIAPGTFAGSKQLFRFDLQNFAVPDGKRCIIPKPLVDRSSPCEDCGGENQWCCQTSPDCEEASNVCNTASSKCEHCGRTNEACCSGGSCESGNACVGSTCLACGGLGEPCCSGSLCTGTWTTCDNNNCVACGDDGQPACSDGSCKEGFYNVGGTCSSNPWRTYTVTCRDCLSAIAEKCLFDPNLWPEICQHNKDIGRIPIGRSCDDIFTGETYEIPPYTGDQTCALDCSCPTVCCGACC